MKESTSKIVSDALEMALELHIGGDVFKIPGANIKSLRIGIRPYGFRAMLSFWVSSETTEDKLFPRFIQPDLMEVTLNVDPHFKPKGAEIESLELHGLVTGKAVLKELTIENIHLKDNPVLYRHYRIDFADSAQVLWGQHFPCDLLVDGTVKNLIEANKATGVHLKYDWDALDKKYAIHTLSLEAGKGASFYDFMIWYAASHNGVFSYDLKEDTYTLSGTKELTGKPVLLSKLEIAEYMTVFPSTIRYNDRLLNTFSENPQKKETSRDQAKRGLRHDNLVCLPVASDFEEAFNLESTKQKIRGHELHLIHSRFPQITYRPGMFVKIEGGLWSDAIFPHGTEYRVRDLFLQAQAVDGEPDADHNMPYSRYHIDMHSRLELKDEGALNLPRFKTPCYPIYVEGKIVSEQGDEKDETYQTYKHPQTAMDQYKVKIPLFDNKDVVVPFDPLFAPGHFYFPAYKGQRVLVALDFHTARIERFLDWRPGGRVPMDSQGNHLLLGKTDSSKTSINHIYVDNKPQFNMKRTFDKDTEKIQLHEGTIILETKEEST